MPRECAFQSGFTKGQRQAAPPDVLRAASSSIRVHKHPELCKTHEAYSTPNACLGRRLTTSRKHATVSVSSCLNRSTRHRNAPWKHSRYSSFCRLPATCMMAMGKLWEEAANTAEASDTSFLSRNSAAVGSERFTSTHLAHAVRSEL